MSNINEIYEDYIKAKGYLLESNNGWFYCYKLNIKNSFMITDFYVKSPFKLKQCLKNIVQKSIENNRPIVLFKVQKYNSNYKKMLKLVAMFEGVEQHDSSTEKVFYIWTNKGKEKLWPMR